MYDIILKNGRTLTQIAAERGTSLEDTAMNLIIEDGSRVGAVHFAMSEDNVRRQVQLPWVSFGSDGASMAAEGDFQLRLLLREPERLDAMRRNAAALGRPDAARDVLRRVLGPAA